MTTRRALPMSYELLQRLCCEELPEKVDDTAEIDKLVVLKEEGMIDADLPRPQQERGHHCYTGQAIVMRVTARGHSAAKKRS